MQLKQFYNKAIKVSCRKKCYYFWWSTWLINAKMVDGYTLLYYNKSRDYHLNLKKPKGANKLEASGSFTTPKGWSGAMLEEHKIIYSVDNQSDMIIKLCCYVIRSTIHAEKSQWPPGWPQASIIFHEIYGAVCIQFTLFSCEYCENMCALSYHNHQIGSKPHLPMFEVRKWNIGMYCMIFIYKACQSRNKTEARSSKTWLILR